MKTIFFSGFGSSSGRDKKHDGTIRVAHETTRNVAKEWPQNYFFLQRAGYDEVDLVLGRGAKNCGSRFACSDNEFVESCGRFKLSESVAKFLCRFLIAFADINQTQRRIEAVPNSFRFRENLHKTGRESAGDSIE